MPYASLPELSLYYEIVGTGQRLLLIPGTNADLRRMPRMIDGVLSRHFQVLSFDQRGLGRSDKPDRAYTMGDYAEDAAALMKLVGWDQALVMGVSFGGAVAQELALRHPQRVQRLALACANPGGGFAFPLHELDRLEPMQRARILLELDSRRTPAWQDAHPEQTQKLLEDSVRRGEPFDPSDPQARAGMTRQLEARSGHDVLRRLPELPMPVGLFGGRYDGLGTVAGQQAMLAAIPGSTLSLFEGGHGFLMEDPAALPMVMQFLAAN